MVRSDRQVIAHTWKRASSAMEASSRLKAAGYKFMTTRRTREWLTCIDAFDLMPRDERRMFVRAWEMASSVTEAWVLLRRTRRGWSRKLSPRLTLEWGRCLRAIGVPLKRMPRTHLPPYR